MTERLARAVDAVRAKSMVASTHFRATSTLAVLAASVLVVAGCQADRVGSSSAPSPVSGVAFVTAADDYNGIVKKADAILSTVKFDKS